MTYLSGKLLSVETRNLGEPLTVAAAIGATSLSVEDATTFDENGGAVTIDGETYSYSGITVDPDTLILTAATTVALDEGVKVDVFPASPVKVALVGLEDGGDTIPATIPHTLLEKFADGLRDASQAESVTIERRGNYEFVLADSVAEPLSQTSLDYVQGSEGTGLLEQVTQLQDATILGDVGVSGSLSVPAVNLGGTDLASMFAALPRGVIRAASKSGTTAKNAGNVTTTELRCFTLNCGDVEAGRLYTIWLKGHLQSDAFPSQWNFTVRYRQDGTEALVTDPVIGIHRHVNSVTNEDFSTGFLEFIPPADGPLSLAVTLDRAGGTAVGSIYQGSSSFKFRILVRDEGLATAYDNTSLSQKIYSDGSGADNPALTTKTTTWLATRTDWYVGAYAGTESPNSTNDDLSVTVGFDPNVYGPASDYPGGKPDYSLVYFNTADILSKLSTAVSITSVKVTFRGLSRVSASGLDINIGTHTYTSAGGAYNWSTEVAASRIVGGVAKANVAPGSTYTVEIGTSALGALFKSGARRGIVIYTPTMSSVGAGRLYYYPHASRPSLSITYTAP